MSESDNQDNRNKMFDKMLKAMKEGKLDLPDYAWLMSADDRPYVRTGKISPPISKHDDVFDLVGLEDVHYSPFIESGIAYRIEKPSLLFEPSKDMVLLSVFQEKIKREIWRMMGIPSRFFDPAIKPYHWQRLPYESVRKWGQRLFNRGLLDNPAIRWEYQKAVLGLPIEAIQWVVVKIRSKTTQNK